ncbi:MAG: single-strand DNA-binding protein [Actinomycetota bacterium]|jgi:single-strand DNA-binding protein|nr:single-strand DNA-binding protein [Actinomycetota bacterium]
MTSRGDSVVTTTNVVAVVGRLARPPEVRELPSGDRLVTYEVTVPRPGERAESLPVVWFEAPARAAELPVDELVVVVGRVRRRFFRTAGGTQSRTEVVADIVVAARQARRAKSALEAAQARLEEACQ